MDRTAAAVAVDHNSARCVRMLYAKYNLYIRIQNARGDGCQATLLR